MKYYSLEHEFLKEGIGAYPQSEKMADHYYFNRADSIWNLNYNNHFVPNLDAIQLVKGAKLLDMLSVVVINNVIGKIISDHFKRALRNFHLPQHRFFEAKVINSRKREIKEKQYFLFRILEHQNQYIDFDKSEFYIHKIGVGEIDKIQIRCAGDLELSFEELGLEIGQLIKAKFVTLLPEFAFDMFCFHRFGAGFFVSERLKTTIEDKGLTGIRFEPAGFIIQKEVTVS